MAEQQKDNQKEQNNSTPSKSKQAENLEQKTQTVFEKIFHNTATSALNFVKPLYTPLWMGSSALLTYSTIGAGPFIMGAGLATGRYLVHKKANRPFKFQHFKEEYLKGIVVGTAVYPLALKINAAATVLEKAVTFLGLQIEAFTAADNFASYFIKNYPTPSKLFKRIYETDLTKVFSEGAASTIKETPKTLYTWWSKPPLLLPVVTTVNWSAHYPLEIKYGMAAATSTGYRYFTTKENKS